MLLTLAMLSYFRLHLSRWPFSGTLLGEKDMLHKKRNDHFLFFVNEVSAFSFLLL